MGNYLVSCTVIGSLPDARSMRGSFYSGRRPVQCSIFLLEGRHFPSHPCGVACLVRCVSLFARVMEPLRIQTTNQDRPIIDPASHPSERVDENGELGTNSNGKGKQASRTRIRAARQTGVDKALLSFVLDGTGNLRTGHVTTVAKFQTPDCRLRFGGRIILTPAVGVSTGRPSLGAL